MKRKTAEVFQKTHDKLCTCLATKGFKPQFHRVDNELALETQQLLEQVFGATVEIVPSHCHRRNAAE